MNGLNIIFHGQIGYDSNNYSWHDGFIGLILMTILGLLPWLVWWLIKKRKAEHNMNCVKNQENQ